MNMTWRSARSAWCVTVRPLRNGKLSALITSSFVLYQRRGQCDKLAAPESPPSTGKLQKQQQLCERIILLVICLFQG